MRNIKMKFLSVLFIAVCMASVLCGQKRIADLNDVSFALNEYYLVVLEDDTYIFGVFRERIDNQIFFQTNYYSTLIADVNDIKYVKKVSEENVLYGKYVPPNAHFNRYFFTQTAFNIPKHSVNLSTFTLCTAIEYGITDHVSVSGGLSLLSILNSEAFNNVRIIAPKIGGFKILSKTKRLIEWLQIYGH